MFYKENINQNETLFVISFHFEVALYTQHILSNDDSPACRHVDGICSKKPSSLWLQPCWTLPADLSAPANKNRQLSVLPGYALPSTCTACSRVLYNTMAVSA